MSTLAYPANEELIRTHLERLYGGVEWPKDVWTTVSYKKDKHEGPGFKVVRNKRFHPSDIDAGVELAVQATNMRKNVYTELAPRRGDSTAELWQRGGKKDIALVRHLFVDVDVFSDVHAIDGNDTKPDNPDRYDALRWLREMQVPVATWSGYGFHGLQTLTKPAAPDDPQLLELVAGWRAAWKALAKKDGYNIDELPLHNMAGLARLAGTYNWKKPDAPQLVTFEYNYDSAVAVGRLLRRFPAPEEKPRTQREQISAAGGASGAPAGGAGGKAKPMDFSLPGNAFARDVSVREILDALGAQRFEPDGYSLRRDDGSYADDPSIQVYNDYYEGGIEHAWVYGDSTAERLGGRRFHSFALMVTMWFVTDASSATATQAGFRKAARFLYNWAETGQPMSDIPAFLSEQKGPLTDAILEVIAADQSAQAAQAQQAPAQSAPEVEQGTPREVDLATFDAHLLKTAAELRSNPVQYQFSSSIVLILGGDLTSQMHGVHKREPRPDGTWGLVRVHDYIPWIRTARKFLMGASTGELVEAAEPSFDVEVIRADLTRHVARDLDRDGAFSMKAILNSNDEAGVEEPEMNMKNTMTNIVRRIGLSVRERLTAYTQTGFAVIDGKATWLAPAGSMTADGVTHEHTVVDTAGSDKGSFKKAHRLMGWKETTDPKDLPRAAEGIRALQDAFARDARHIVTSAFGTLFAAPAGLDARPTFWVTGAPESGKSALLGALFTHISRMRTGGKPATADLGGITFAALLNRTGWSKNMIVVADDFKLTGARSDAVISDSVNNFIRAVYSGAVPERGKAGGGNRAMPTVNTSAIVSGEQSPPQGSAATRTLEVIWDLSYIKPYNESGISPLDNWAEMYGDSGYANKLVGAFYQWLAARIDALGGSWEAYEDQTADVVRALRREYGEALGGSKMGRARETGLGVLAGWKLFYTFAEEKNIAHILPSWDSIVEDVAFTVTSAHAENGDESNWAKIIFDEFQNMVTTKRGYVTRANGATPNDPLTCGWIFDPASGGYTRPHGAELLGEISDEAGVFVYTATLRHIAKYRLGREVPRAGNLKRIMLHAGADPNVDHDKKKTVKAMGFTNNQRGYVFPLMTVLPSREGISANWPDEVPVAPTPPAQGGYASSAPTTDDDEEF